MNISVYFLISFTFLKTVCSFEWTFNVKCYLKECCERQYIPLDFDSKNICNFLKQFKLNSFL